MDQNHILSELDGILEKYRELSGMDNGRPSAGTDMRSLIDKAVSAVRKFSGGESDYTLAITVIAEEYEGQPGGAGLVFGVLKALRDDIRQGRFAPVPDPMYLDPGSFLGFLNVAMQQLSRGDVKAATVLAGSTLETHLRKMASRNGLDIEDAEGAPLPVSRVVTSLIGSGALGEKERQSVEGWLDMRAAASSGRAEQLAEDQVRTMIAGINAFLTRNPV